MSDSKDLASAIERLEAAAKHGERREAIRVRVEPCDLRTVLDALRELQTKEKKSC